MNKEEIIRQLKERHEIFVETIDALTEDDFLFAPPEKWSAGQQVDHIYRSVATLFLAMRIPKPAIKLVIGKAKGPFIPSAISYAEKKKLIEKVRSVIEKLSNRINQFSEKDLDEMILPHPLLGKLTMREMLFFTIYHVQHHQRLMTKYLELKN